MTLLPRGAEKYTAGTIVQEDRLGVVGLRHGKDGPTLNRAFTNVAEFDSEIQNLLQERVSKRARTGTDHNLLLIDTHGRTAQAIQIMSSYTLTGELLWGPRSTGAHRFLAYSSDEENALTEELTARALRIIGNRNPKEVPYFCFDLETYGSDLKLTKVSRIAPCLFAYERGEHSLAVQKRSD